MEKKEAQIQQLRRAVKRFAEVLDLPLDEHGTVRDSAIQRFEFCVDLSWKTVKTVLENDHSIQCASPKGCLKEAFAVGIIAEDDPFWLTMLELRNLSVHTYNEETAAQLYSQLPDTLNRFQMLLRQLES